MSSAAVWSKWKRFQLLQSACVILYLGHTNWLTGDGKWHHYFTKCSPPFDFLCIFVEVSKYFYLRWQFAERPAAKKKKKGSGIQSLSLMSGSGDFALLSKDQTSHSLIWSDLGELSSEVIDTTEDGWYQSD